MRLFIAGMIFVTVAIVACTEPAEPPEPAEDDYPPVNCSISDRHDCNEETVRRCRILGDRVAMAVRGRVYDQVIGGVWVALDVPFASDDLFSLRVVCWSDQTYDPARVGVELVWDAISPPRGFWSVAALAGAAITGDKPATVEDAARKCVKNALRSEHEMGEVTRDQTRAECMAFTRDGGGNSVRIHAVDGYVEPRDPLG